MNKTCNILGLNCAYHESAACVLIDGRLVSFMEEERLNRHKHAKPALVNNADQLPKASIKYCLKAAGLEFKDIDYIAYNLEPREGLGKAFEADNGHKITTGSWGTAVGEEIFFNKNLNVPKKLSQLFKRDVRSNFHFIKHHLAHAAGTYYSSGYPSAAILIVDGRAETQSTWLGMANNKQIKNYLEIDYPNSVGFVWEKMSEFLGFNEYDAEKVMGLASYGDYTKKAKAMAKLISTEKEKIFRVDNDILLFRTGDFSRLEKLFGIQKRTAGQKLTAKHQNIAAALQHATEEIVLALARQLKKISGQSRLCMSGGAALNVVSNAKLIRAKIFKQVYIQPQANDAGGAIGAAFYLHRNILQRPKPLPISNAYLGPEFSNHEIHQILKKYSALDFELRSNITQDAAKLLADGNLIGWFQGRMEAGPRALGHRSLLADPRNPDIMAVINNKVKLREYFRPLAPSVLEEQATNWFKLSRPFPSPTYYMLMAVAAKKQRQGLIPAVVHVDGTSRIQIVNKKISPKYWNLISKFYKLTGIPMVLNTSLNIQEPIVCSPQDAINTFLRSRIDYLVLGDFLCERKTNLSRGM